MTPSARGSGLSRRPTVLVVYLMAAAGTLTACTQAGPVATKSTK